MLSKNVANHLLSEVHEGLQTLEKPPHLVGLLANNDPAALTYAQMTQKTCEEK
jgi:methylenetetrahydrofolate dehydrogenase (NAD+)